MPTGRGEEARPCPQPAPNEPQFTVETIREGMKRSAKGADELNKQLKDVFSLSDSGASLRLR